MVLQEPPGRPGKADQASRRDVIEFLILIVLLGSAIAFIAWNRTAYRENFIENLSEESASPAVQL